MRKKRSIAVALGVFYLGSYTYFSLNGQFLTMGHGGSDYSREWSPKYLIVDTTGSNSRPKRGCTFLGIVYLPCIMVDRLLWHQGPKKYLPWKVVYHKDISGWPSYEEGTGTHWVEDDVEYIDQNGDGVIDVRIETRDEGQLVSIKRNDTDLYFFTEMHSSDHPRVNFKYVDQVPVPNTVKSN